MKNNFFILLAIVVLQSCAEAPVKAPTIDKIKQVEMGLTAPVYIEGDTTWTIEEGMSVYGVPGVSIAVINNGEIEWSKSYGVMNKEDKSPVTEQTLFQAASISKPVTAYAALTLVEQNKVDLNEDINTYLKSWELSNNEFTEEKKVTLKNLLNHSAGTTVHGFLGYSPGLPVPTLLEVLNGTSPANSGTIFVDKVPEESFRYSGGGYNIVQQMMIDVEGNTFPEIMNALVLDPLEMNNSTYAQPLEGAQLQLAATGYLPDGSMTKGKRHTYPEMAPAGLWTTAEDLAKFAISIQQALKGGQVKGLSQEMTTKMLTPFVEDFIGLGIFIEKKKDEIYFEHGGWNEGFSSQLIAHKDKGYGVVVLTNSNHPAFISELIRSVALAYEWDQFVPVYKKLELDHTSLSKIEGRYALNGNNLVELFQAKDQLFYKELGEDWHELVRISDSTYVKRQDNYRLFQFKPSTDQQKAQMLILKAENGKLIDSYARLDSDEKIPFEFLIDGEFNEALEAYQALILTDPNDPASDENNLNNVGYRYLLDDQITLAKDIFKVNMALYPNSFNVYDSYAEACLENGETDLAIEYYEKSISLNPDNVNAIEIVKGLKN